MIDWIPIFEDRQIDYNIDIPEQPFRVKLDTDGYMRILNNLIQNVISHSHADKIEIFLSKQEKNMQIRLTDNGIGIEKEDLKYYFPEFAPYENTCKFNGCCHSHEPGCEVKKALEEGKISKMRYDDYCMFYEELAQQKKW